MRLNIINMSPEYSAIWKYGVNLKKALQENATFSQDYEVHFIDLWKDNLVSHNSVVRALQLVKGIKLNLSKKDINLYTLPLMSKFMKLNPCKKNIMMVHDLYPLQVKDDLVLHYLCKHIYTHISKADLILTNSEYTSEEYEDYYGGKTKAIHLGIEDNIYFNLSNLNKNSKLTLISIGRDEPRKNLTFMIEVLNRLQLQGLPFCMNRVGTFSKEHKELIDRYMLQDKIQVLENVNEKELLDLYSMSHFLLFPSLQEGFGLPPIEAMCCKCIPLTSKNGSLPEVVDIPELSSDLNAEVWASIIVYLWKVKGERDRLSHLCKVKSIQYTWYNYSNKLIPLLRLK